jgi:flagellar biosynthesis protein FlhF
MDTAGRNLFAPLQRSELFAYIPQGNNVETHLVLSMTMNYADMRRLVESFQGQQTFKLLFTKLDESSKIGHIFNLIHHFSHPVSYLSTGQNVPDDLQQAELKGLIQALLRGNP